MTHVRQELALGQVGTLGGFFGLPQFFLSAFAGGDIDKRDHRTQPPSVSAYRVGPVFGRKAGAIGTPEHLVVHMRPYAPLKRSVNGAVVHRIRRAVRPGVVHQLVHVFAQQVAGVGVSQQAGTGRIAEGAAAVEINAVNRLGRGIEQQPYLFLLLLQLRLSAQNAPANASAVPPPISRPATSRRSVMAKMRLTLRCAEMSAASKACCVRVWIPLSRRSSKRAPKLKLPQLSLLDFVEGHPLPDLGLHGLELCLQIVH